MGHEAETFRCAPADPICCPTIINMTKMKMMLCYPLTKSFSFVVPEINLSLVVPINSTVMINECGDYILLQPIYIFTDRIFRQRNGVCMYIFIATMCRVRSQSKTYRIHHILTETFTVKCLIKEELYYIYI